jgi:anti-anti-sigma factor
VLQHAYPVRWTGRQAVVVLPEHIDVSNAGPIREEFLSLINRGAKSLIADLTATISCDHAGADTFARAHKRAVVSGTELRLVVTAQIVRRMLSINGLDRLVAVYPSLDAATAARPPAVVIPLGPRRPDGPAAAITPAVVWNLVDAIQDGVALTDGQGLLALANRRLEEMLGYQHGELAGLPVEALLPESLRDAHRDHRASYSRAPAPRPMGASAQLVAQRKDGTTFPAEISLSPVTTTTGTLTLTVIRDVTETRRLANLARSALGSRQARQHRDLLDTVITNLYDVGLTLHAVADLPQDSTSDRIAEALDRLDDTIRQIRDTTFNQRDQ